MTVFKRIVKAGFLNFKRNGLVSFAAVLNITTTLAVVVSILLLQAVLYSSLDQIKNKVDVTIYLKQDATESRVSALKDSLLKLPEVQEISYTSAEDNLKNFHKLHTDDYSTLQALDEIKVNPLLAYFNVRAKEISQYESIANFLDSNNPLVLGSDSVVYKINYNQNKKVIDKLNTIISGAQKLSFVLTLVLIVICLINTLNTIRLIILISKEEIGVMRLVGASKLQIRGPFMIEGAIYGIIATILTLIIFWPATAWLGRNMTNFLGLNIYDYYVSNLFQIFIIVLLSGVLLGMISSYIAVRRYLYK